MQIYNASLKNSNIAYICLLGRVFLFSCVLLEGVKSVLILMGVRVQRGRDHGFFIQKKKSYVPDGGK